MSHLFLDRFLKTFYFNKFFEEYQSKFGWVFIKIRGELLSSKRFGCTFENEKEFSSSHGSKIFLKQNIEKWGETFRVHV